MTKKLTTCTLNSLIGLLFLLFFIALGLVVAIFYRPFYYGTMDELSASTGYSQEDIKLNYDTLIDYCSPFYTGELEFPTLPSSSSGLSHFAEVKVIFNVFYAMLILIPVLLAILIFIQHKRKVSSYLLTSPLIMFFVPLFFLSVCAIDFDTAFTIFHEIVFSNDDWFFDPATDPIIRLLPPSFFLNCTYILITSVLSGCIILSCIYIFKNKSVFIRSQSQ